MTKGSSLVEDYKESLADFMESPGEEQLEQAYQIGRRALQNGLSFGEIGELHFSARRDFVTDRQITLSTLHRSEEFFLEVTSVYDMALRGYRDTIARLQVEIEERRSVEQDLRAAAIGLTRQQELLEQRVKERTQELSLRTEALERANDELLRSNRELDDFAYIASHDLKEPLRATYNHARFLLEDYQDKLEDGGKKRLDRLIALSQRMEKLIADLLFFSRLGRGEDAREPLDTSAIINDISEVLGDTFQSRQARLSINGELPSIVGNKAHVTVVFQNLILNGIKYNDAEEKTIEIGFLPEVEYQAARLTDVFYVRDNGIGIEEKFKDQIFRIFKRLNSEKAYGEGTGAGLSFVKKIVESIGGKIWLDSEVGKGTTFFFTMREAT